MRTQLWWVADTQVQTRWEAVVRNSFVKWRGAAGAFASALLLGACGEPAPPAANGPAASSRQDRSGSAATIVNAFEFTASGDVEAAAAPAASELSLTGGCTSHGPMSIGFTNGTPTEEGYFHFAFESAEPVSPGQTGAIPLSEIAWDNGVEAPRNMPANSPLRVPSRFSGEGTLTLQSHSGAGMGGRMAGVVEGVVTHAFSQERATLSVSFDVNLACVS
jgi:hypothetical protein